MKKLHDPEANAKLAEKEQNENELAWELNQATITKAIVQHITMHGSMPTKAHLAILTGLNRSTIQKHLSASRENFMKKEKESLGLLTNHVMARVFQAAANGNLQAAKLFMDRLDPVEKPAVVREAVQNNYVQLNKTVINQQVIQQLMPDDLQQIEQIISKRLKEAATVEKTKSK